jgi:branched-chain amino acid transport system substrate-binding protein
MRGKALPRRRVLSTCTSVAVAVAIAGCTAPASNQTVSGGTLTVYASVPPAGVGGQQARDVLAAEQLAYHQNGPKIGNFKLRFLTTAGGEISDNARAAIQDSSAIAYLGELVPGQSADSLGITNAQDLLQVTPTDTALALTQSSAAVPNSPNRYYESLSSNGRTFARVVPTTSLEAKAQVEEMQALHVSKLYVGTDGSQYGGAVAQAVRTDAARASISLVPTPAGAGAVFYGASSLAAAARLFNSTASSSPTVKLFGPSALSDTALVALLAPSVRNLYVSAPGFLPGGLTAQAKTQFVGPFVSAYHHAPAPQAIFGYEAMSALLAVLRQAGSSAGDRHTVVSDFFGIRNRNSVLGSYSINAAGDTSIAPFIFSRLAGGKLVPFKSVPVQG